jgi:hypothetical protein
VRALSVLSLLRDQKEHNITTLLCTFTSTMAIYRVGLLCISGLLAQERTTSLRIASDDAARTAMVRTVIYLVVKIEK